MIKINQINLGKILIGFAIFLIFILAFIKVDSDEKERFFCEAVEANPDLEMSECPMHQDHLSWVLLLAVGIAFLILGIGIYMIFVDKRLESKISFRKIDLSRLDQDEKKIYEIIKNNEGSVYQSEIVKETGFSKVKTTRILDKMEAKKIIERKRRGMTNIIVLKD